MADKGGREKALILAQFRQFDIDGSGSIDSAELATALARVNPKVFSPENVKSMFAAMDADNDGFVTAREFVSWALGGSTDVVNVAIEGLTETLEQLKKLLADSQKPELRFWVKTDRPHLSFEDFVKAFKSDYPQQVFEEDTEREYWKPSDEEILQKQTEDFDAYHHDIKSHPEGRAMCDLSGVPDVDKTIRMAEGLLSFLDKGGFAPQGQELEVWTRRNLLNAWKTKASKMLDGFLVSKVLPGQEREAVYKLIGSDVHHAFVGKLPGVKWQPQLLASSDGKGGWQLPLNEAQKVFDLLKPAQLSSLAMERTSELTQIIDTLDKAASKGCNPPLHLEKLIAIRADKGSKQAILDLCAK